KTHILLVGDGPKKRDLISLAKKYNLNNITFLNKVERNQVTHILQKSNCCLFHLKDTPVFQYGLSSNKLFDYMISGKPMIFAVNTSFDFAEAARNGVSIPSDNPAEMANEILLLKNMSESDREKLG